MQLDYNERKYNEGLVDVVVVRKPSGITRLGFSYHDNGILMLQCCHKKNIALSFISNFNQGSTFDFVTPLPV